jgi:hypothetical protein
VKLLRAGLFTIFATMFAVAQVATKIDEFEEVPCDHHLAYMDHLISESSKNPESMVYVFVYEGRERGSTWLKWVLPPRHQVEARIASMKAYFRQRKFAANNFVFLNGGVRRSLTVEEWLVPAGAKTPQPTPSTRRIRHRRGRARGFCTWCC